MAEILQLISQGVIINFGQNILNTHDNVADSDDMIIVLIEAYISTDNLEEPTNQVTAWDLLGIKNK